MHIHILQHESFESPAAIGEWINKRGYSLSITRFFEFEQLPASIDHIDMLVILGGPQSPSTTKTECPHFDAWAEKKFISRVIEAGKKVLGICLGAQLIGETLGAKTEHSPQREIGLFQTKLSAEGLNDVLTSLLPETFYVGHWHGDMPGLTPTCQVLAASRGCPRQIVRYSSKVYGFQCHFEFTPTAINAMIENCLHELETFAGYPFVETTEKLRSNNYSEMNTMLFKMLDKFSTIR